MYIMVLQLVGDSMSTFVCFIFFPALKQLISNQSDSSATSDVIKAQ